VLHPFPSLTILTSPNPVHTLAVLTRAARRIHSAQQLALSRILRSLVCFLHPVISRLHSLITTSLPHFVTWFPFSTPDPFQLACSSLLTALFVCRGYNYLHCDQRLPAWFRLLACCAFQTVPNWNPSFSLHLSTCDAEQLRQLDKESTSLTCQRTIFVLSSIQLSIYQTSSNKVPRDYHEDSHHSRISTSELPTRLLESLI
jgi:hypothetical protein